MENMEDQFNSLLLLADTAMLLLEKENMADDRTLIAGFDIQIDDNNNKKRKLGSSSFSLSDHKNPTKVRRLFFSFCSSNGQKQTFVLGNNGGHWFTVPKKKRTTVGKKRLMSPFSSSSSPSSSSSSSGRSSRDSETPIGQAREMPSAMRDAIVENGGGDFILVAEKKLFDTDVTWNNNRLSMPKKALVASPEEFLREEEIARVNEKAGFKVEVLDEELREYKLSLKYWKMGKNMILNLVSGWNPVVERNALKKDDLVQLWAFRRRDLQLGFAIVVPRRANTEHS